MGDAQPLAMREDLSPLEGESNGAAVWWGAPLHVSSLISPLPSTFRSDTLTP